MSKLPGGLPRIWSRYSLSITLAALWLATTVAHFLVQRVEFADEQRDHGKAFAWSEFWPAFGRSTFENWQSEFLQLFTFVVLSALLVHRGSPESRDTEEKAEGREIETLRRLDRIEKMLEERR